MPPTPSIPVPRVDPGVHRGPLAPVGPGALSALEAFRVDPTAPPGAEPARPASPAKSHVKNDVKISTQTYGRAEPPPPLGDYDKVHDDEPASLEPEPEHIRKQREKEETAPAADLDSSLNSFFEEHGKGEDGEDGEEAEETTVPAPEEAATTPPAEEPPQTPPSDEDIAKELEAFGKGPKPLRKAFEAARKREAKLMKEKAEIVAKLQEREVALQGYQAGTEASEAHKAEVESLRKVAAEREEQIRILDYTKSGEFTDRYQKPLEGALTRAYAEIGKMEVVNEDGTTRPASEDDFQTLVRIDNPAKAGEMAEKLFGKYGAAEAMSHRRTVQDLFRARQEALTNAATESKTLMEKRTAEVNNHRQQSFAKFSKAKQEILTGKYKDLLGEVDGDEEGNNLLRSNLSRFEKVMTDGGDPEGQLKTAAEIHVMAAKLPVALRDIKKLRAELADAQKQLKGFQKSAPRGGERSANGHAKPTHESPMEAALAGIDNLPGRNR